MPVILSTVVFVLVFSLLVFCASLKTYILTVEFNEFGLNRDTVKTLTVVKKSTNQNSAVIYAVKKLLSLYKWDDISNLKISYKIADR